MHQQTFFDAAPVNEASPPAPRGSLLGCPVDLLTLSQTVERIVQSIRHGEYRRHCAVNASKIVHMTDEPRVHEAVRTADFITADGQSIVWALQMYGYDAPERVTGIDIMYRLLKEANRHQFRVYFLGAKQEVLDTVLAIVRQRYPKLVVAGSHHGYFPPADDAKMADAIAATEPDIVFVAMTSPRKEFWTLENFARLKAHFVMGVGGSFDVLAGKTKRAPGFFRRNGLEWFYRLIQEPRRLAGRYTVQNLRFLYIVTRARFQKNWRPTPRH